MKKRIVSVILGAALLVCSLTACGAKTDGAEYRKIVEEYAPLFLAMDGDGLRRDEAMDAVGQYLDGSMSREAALEKLDGTITAFEEAALSLAEQKYVLTDEMSALLRDYDILPEEFEFFVNSRESDIQSYLTDLRAIQEYLSYAEEYAWDMKNLQFQYKISNLIQESMRGYYYYMGVNYWFAGWTKEQVETVREMVTDQIRSYRPAVVVWETDREIIEQRADLCLDDVETCLEKEAEYVVDEKSDLLNMQRNFDMMMELIRIESKLKWAESISERLDKLGAEIADAKEAQDKTRLAELKEQLEALEAEYAALIADDE